MRSTGTPNHLKCSPRIQLKLCKIIKPLQEHTVHQHPTGTWSPADSLSSVAHTLSWELQTPQLDVEAIQPALVSQAVCKDLVAKMAQLFTARSDTASRIRQLPWILQECTKAICSISCKMKQHAALCSKGQLK